MISFDQVFTHPSDMHVVNQSQEFTELVGATGGVYKGQENVQWTQLNSVEAFFFKHQLWRTFYIDVET